MIRFNICKQCGREFPLKDEEKKTTALLCSDCKEIQKEQAASEYELETKDGKILKFRKVR